MITMMIVTMSIMIQEAIEKELALDIPLPKGSETWWESFIGYPGILTYIDIVRGRYVTSIMESYAAADLQDAIKYFEQKALNYAKSKAKRLEIMAEGRIGEQQKQAMGTGVFAQEEKIGQMQRELDAMQVDMHRYKVCLHMLKVMFKVCLYMYKMCLYRFKVCPHMFKVCLHILKICVHVYIHRRGGGEQRNG